ncbi:sulfur carrier protein ThiS [Salipiger sp.]|uniref:sulfur carrier protein ThiS n=1 Tax=Salipiger sp. TaxID=2078585 RepID=UPI003A97544D
MRIDLNGTGTETGAATLAELIAAMEVDAASVATAVDGQFVPLGLRDATRLQEGSRVEVLSPMQGG